MDIGLVLFWSSVLLIVYTYLGYPCLLWLWAKIRSRPCRRQGGEPSVVLIIVAHDEARRMDARLQNVLSLDYPRHRLEIWLASDGSTDGTVEQARAYEPAGVRVIEFQRHRGKPATLSDVIPRANGEIVVLADARQRFDSGAIRMLVAPFADPQVGAVSGELVLTPDSEGTAVAHGLGCTWRYEKFIRRNESLVDSSVGVTGAIYAIRRDLFETLPGDTILDDVWIPMRIVRRGYRVLFQPSARAYDQAPLTVEEDFTRKVRTMAGKFQLLARERWLLSPLRNRLWLQTFSHTVLRALVPLFIVGALGANLLLLESLLYRWTLGGQILFYGAALAGYSIRSAKKGPPLFSVPFVFCLVSWATVVGFFRFVTGRQPVTWEKVSAYGLSQSLREEVWSPKEPAPSARRLQPPGHWRRWSGHSRPFQH